MKYERLSADGGRVLITDPERGLALSVERRATLADYHRCLRVGMMLQRADATRCELHEPLMLFVYGLN